MCLKSRCVLPRSKSSKLYTRPSMRWPPPPLLARSVVPTCLTISMVLVLCDSLTLYLSFSLPGTLSWLFSQETLVHPSNLNSCTKSSGKTSLASSTSFIHLFIQLFSENPLYARHGARNMIENRYGIWPHRVSSWVVDRDAHWTSLQINVGL